MLLMCILVVKDSLGHIRVVWCRIQFFFTSRGLLIYYWRERERERERERDLVPRDVLIKIIQVMLK